MSAISHDVQLIEQHIAMGVTAIFSVFVSKFEIHVVELHIRPLSCIFSVPVWCCIDDGRSVKLPLML